MTPTTSNKPITVDAMARKINVDNRIPLYHYYRISESLLKQANIYRAENNILDLYVILLRYSSLVCETIPKHRDFNVTHSKEKTYYRKKLLGVLDELEILKPEFQRRVDELNKVHGGDQRHEIDGLERPAYRSRNSALGGPAVNWRPSQIHQPTITAPQSSSSANILQVGKQFQNLSMSLPLPRKETLSKHSLLGPNGLRSQWQGPSAEIKVQYPSNSGIIVPEISGVSQVVQHGLGAVKDDDLGVNKNVMESLLSLDDGRWALNAQESSLSMKNGANENRLQVGIIRQPSPPPVLAQISQEYAPIPSSKVADPRPGPANSFHDGDGSSTAYQHLHIPVKIMDDFLRLAKQNTAKNLETCAVLAGSLKNRVFYITTLIIPKQESTSDSCQTLNEEEIFEVQDKLSLFTLGWIHTHPTQTCFMSSVDLHTHYSYQIMLPEAIAIVMAPTDTSSPHAIFHLSDPSGVSVIRNCQQRGFHPHEEPSDGSPIYEHCSHVYMNPNLKFEVLDLR